MSRDTADFSRLSPELILSSLEEVLPFGLTGLLTPYPSYINRVYEVLGENGRRLIVKFYRPGRWSPRAILEEHRFLGQCTEAEIPAAAPLPLDEDGTTLALAGGEYPFALFEKKAGRLFELNGSGDYRRAGSLIARVHTVGAAGEARRRTVLHPLRSAREDRDYLLSGGLIPPPLDAAMEEVLEQIITAAAPLFEGIPLHRIHGDCHRGNILERPGEGLMMIDFDDMAVGPAMQDLWMLLPDHLPACRREMSLLMEGYEQFRPLNPRQLRLAEPLRALRMLYYLAWCARQRGDRQFRHDHPQWGTFGFWEEEIRDFRNQLEEII